MVDQPNRLPPPEGFLPEGLHRAPRILVADGDASTRRLLEFHLRRSGAEVTTVEDGASALGEVERQGSLDLVLLDLGLPGDTGPETLRALIGTGHVGGVIVMTAQGTMADAVAALKDGAYDFVTKSRSFDDVRVAIRNALHAIGLREEVQSLRQRLLEQEDTPAGIVGTSPPIRQVLKLVRKVAGSNITVLVQGESGTGKELVARAIHAAGQQKEGPFVALNCAAIPENLLESELFGHERGSFTGATARRIGKFEEAHEGTLFLDEIGELSLPLQAKLLRVLQTQEIQPVGGTLKRVKVRVVSATNQDLLQAVQGGRFRQDLYYRLAVFPIELPPLRERREDIPLLVQYFLRRFASQEQKTLQGVEREALARLSANPWYGNIRELENLIYRAVVLSEDRLLRLKDFPSLPPAELAAPAATEAVASGVPPLPPAGTPALPANPFTAPSAPERSGFRTLEQAEAETIQRAVADCGGNMSRAAVQLRIGRATLYRKFRKYGMHRA